MTVRKKKILAAIFRNVLCPFTFFSFVMDEKITTVSSTMEAPPEPPAGIIFSNVLPTDIFINIGQGGYEIIDTPHAQDTYTRHRKHRTFQRRNNYMLHSTFIQERRLRILANSGYIEELRKLLENCSHTESVINGSDNKKRTALHFAASRGSDDIVHLLLLHGADPNVRDLNGNTPLHLAACTHHIRVITLLLRFGADVKATDSFGKTPLHLSLSRLRMLQSRDVHRSGKASVYTATKRKADVGEIVAMLTEYFDKSGQKDEHVRICEINKKLWEVQTEDEVIMLVSFLHLLRVFTELFISRFTT